MRRITIDGLTYLCNVTKRGNIEHITAANTEEVAEFLRNNGALIIYVNEKEIMVDATFYHYDGKKFQLLQCEGDLLEWAVKSKEGDFTYYYDKVVFHCADGFHAAYRDDITNHWKI